MKDHEVCVGAHLKEYPLPSHTHPPLKNIILAADSTVEVGDGSSFLGYLSPAELELCLLAG